MQQVASPQQPNPNFRTTGNNRSTVVVILALVLFALSGLMTGFATGAFTRPKQTASQGNKGPNGTAPTAVITQQTPNASVTSVAQVTRVGCPAVDQFSDAEIADGSHPYTLLVHATDTSGGTCNSINKRISAAGITFKMWLIHRIPDDQGISFSHDSLKNADNLINPITATIPKDGAEEVEGLTFDNASSQVQRSDAQGNVTWHYTVSPSVEDGNYDMVILVDWAGQYYNWTWRNISVKKAS